MTDAGMNRFGSGWSWLVLDGGDLKVISSANQDSPLMDGQVPLRGMDVWEHACYLKCQNRRADYLSGDLERHRPGRDRVAPRGGPLGAGGRLGSEAATSTEWRSALRSPTRADQLLARFRP
jgi:hypothetical protein